MNLIPQMVAVGGALPPEAAGRLELASANRLEEAWAELAVSHGLTEMRRPPNRRAVWFLGPGQDDRIAIDPPNVRSRRRVSGDVEGAARLAVTAVAGIARVAGAGEIQGLVVRYVCRAGLDRPADRLMAEEFLGSSEEDMAALGAEGRIAAGVRYLVPRPEATFELRIGAVDAGQSDALRIELIARFAQPAPIRLLAERVSQAQSYLTGPVSTFLARHMVPGEIDEPAADGEG